MKSASQLRLIRTAPVNRVSIIAAALLVTAVPLRATAVPIRASAEPVTAAIGVSLTALGMVVNWVNSNSDDVKAAASAITSGDHQGHTRFKSDSGWGTAGPIVAESPESDQNASVYASSYAHEGILGTTISGGTYEPWTHGFVYPLEKTPDKHHMDAAAQASIDGHVEGTGEGGPATSLSIGNNATPATVNFNVFLNAETFLLAQPADLPSNASSSVSWEFSQSIDGVERFFTSIYLDNLGKLVFNYHPGVAGFASDAFQLTATADSYEIAPVSNYSENGKNYYVQTFFSDIINPATVTGVVDGPVFAYDLSGAANMATSASAESDVPEPSQWALTAIGLCGISVVMRLRHQT